MFSFDPPKNIGKPKVFGCFQGDQKGALGRKGLIKFGICLFAVSYILLIFYYFSLLSLFVLNGKENTIFINQYYL